jgi:hypothetical protein
MIELYNEDWETIGDVEYNTLLDYWDGRNYVNGGTGRHKGFGQLEDGRFYLIFGTQWQGEKNYAKIATPEEIVKECIKSDNIDLLEQYPELLELYKTKFEKIEISEKSKTFSIRININDLSETIDKKIEKMRQKIKDFQEI